MPDQTTILLADSDTTSREFATDVLGAYGYRVLHADTDAALLEMARDAQPALTLLDAAFADADGYALCGQLRSGDRTQDIPVVMLLTEGALKDEIRALRAGADESLIRPLREDALMARVQSALPGPTEKPTARVLVVDDSSVNLQVMEGYLHTTGYVIDLADNGIDALALAQQTPPDVVLLDVQMPGMDGYAVCAALKQDPRTNGIPIMFVTANALSNTEMLRGYDLGAVDYLRKPFLRDELLARLQVMIRIKQQQSDLEGQVLTDALTGLANRRHLVKRLSEEFSRARRHSQPLTVLMMDIDHFKLINDGYGHERGDEVLREIGTLLQELVRTEDLVARYGGEEFAMLLPETELDAAVGLADRIRNAIAALHVENGEATIRVTVSIGAATFPMLDIERPRELVRYADAALDAAKGAGRNQVQAYRPSTPIQ